MPLYTGIAGLIPLRFLHTIRQVGGRVLSCLPAWFAGAGGQAGSPGAGGISFAAKAAAGLLFACIILFAAGLISAVGVEAARTMLGRMTKESLPRLEAAVALEHQVYATMAHISAYSLTGDAARYSLARELLANIKAMTGKEGAFSGPAVREKAQPLHELVRKLDTLIEDERALIESRAAGRSPEPTPAGEGAGGLHDPADRKRLEIFDALAVEVRGEALRAAEDIAARADNAQAALYGALLTLLAAVVLGCLLTATGAVLFWRGGSIKRSDS